jgi:hypothetical protein
MSEMGYMIQLQPVYYKRTIFWHQLQTWTFVYTTNN